jgi:Flp pilus assembly protein TadD
MEVIQQQFERAMGAAITAFNRGHLGAAAQMCQDILRGRPDEPAVHQLLAVICLQQHQPVDAFRHIGRSLEGRPGHSPSLLIAGRIAWALQDLDAALGLFKKAAAMAPQESEPLYQMGSVLVEQGRLADAADVLLRLVQLHPSHAPAWCRLGAVLQQAGMQDRAEAALERAIALDKNQADAWFHTGLLRQDRAELAGAAQAFRVALQLQPDFAEAAVNLGIVLQEDACVDEAMAAYRTAYQLRSATFGRIANALASRPHGRLWTDLSQLRQLLAA